MLTELPSEGNGRILFEVVDLPIQTLRYGNIIGIHTRDIAPLREVATGVQ